MNFFFCCWKDVRSFFLKWKEKLKLSLVTFPLYLLTYLIIMFKKNSLSFLLKQFFYSSDPQKSPRKTLSVDYQATIQDNHSLDKENLCLLQPQYFHKIFIVKTIFLILYILYENFLFYWLGNRKSSFLTLCHTHFTSIENILIVSIDLLYCWNVSSILNGTNIIGLGYAKQFSVHWE